MRLRPPDLRQFRALTIRIVRAGSFSPPSNDILARARRRRLSSVTADRNPRPGTRARAPLVRAAPGPWCSRALARSPCGGADRSVCRAVRRCGKALLTSRAFHQSAPLVIGVSSRERADPSMVGMPVTLVGLLPPDRIGCRARFSRRDGVRLRGQAVTRCHPATPAVQRGHRRPRKTAGLDNSFGRSPELPSTPSGGGSIGRGPNDPGTGA